MHTLPPDHPLRIELNDEVHARPSESLKAPLRVTFLALYSDPADRAQEWEHVSALLRRYGHEPPPRATHYSADLGPFRLKWERHSEFARYKFIVEGAAPDPFETPALAAVPADWLAGLGGRTLVATHAAVLPAPAVPLDYEEIAARHFAGNVLVGAAVADGAGVALTDFRIRDGYGRLLLLDRTMTQRQAGRMLQRLLEIDTYRLLALLTLPVAQQLTPWLTTAERELAEVTSQLVGATEASEPVLLDRLTRLEAEIEQRESAHHYRFTAASAYYGLVQRRIEELREVRIQGLQTFQEFTGRRLAPAMNTCTSVAARIESLSQRVARATQLLSTRVDVSRERQNQQVLASLNRRAEAQLRLQQTVEGLSAAAITYYVVGLVGYVAKGLAHAGWPISVETVVALSIPVVALATIAGVRHVRKVVARAIE
ncbi:MAG: DUF3422 domain-containing protein [Lysobacterales bacterium]|nr:MAG: DUF3422 domain-containing protein [Xanthomonadales bacterium]RPI13750.1 MAG: DUF3422 domain-containing protein [Xanthomonadales bacterium]